TRDVANVTMDLNDVERIELSTIGGADNVTIGDLSGTDLQQIELDLRGPNGGGDGAVDRVTVNGTNNGDNIVVFGDAGGVGVSGLQAQINIFQTDATDQLVING